jgi:hypothetical protein
VLLALRCGAPVGMKWFRSNIKTGSRLALFALAIQFALSFGHFHGVAVQAAPVIQAGSADADLAIATTLAAPQTRSEASQQPSNHDTDQQTSDCAICAVISLANNFLFATPPLLELPQAVELLHLTTGAEFTHLGSLHPAFQSRAPPAS